MKVIQLTQGQVALVDDADYEWLKAWKWQALWSPNTQNFYAVRATTINGKKRGVKMHREILGLEYGDKLQTDHRNMNSLDNRRENLRIATHGQNMANRRALRNSTHGIKGVTRQGTGWRARISDNGYRITLGTYAKAVDAHMAYREAALHIYGEFTRSF